MKDPGLLLLQLLRMCVRVFVVSVLMCKLRTPSVCLRLAGFAVQGDRERAPQVQSSPDPQEAAGSAALRVEAEASHQDEAKGLLEEAVSERVPIVRGVRRVNSSEEYNTHT